MTYLPPDLEALVQTRPIAAGPSPAFVETKPQRGTLLLFRQSLAAQLLGPLLLVLVWQVASSTGVLSPKLLASPWSAVMTGLELLRDGTLPEHFLASANRAYAGLLLGTVVAVSLALAAGLTRSGDALIDGIVQIKRAIPTLALIPLAILWLGIGDAMKVALISLSAGVPVYINTHAGLRGLDLRYVELAESLGLSRGQFIRSVALPAALPEFFVGLRLAVTTCWTSLVVLEQINTSEGIGYLMNRARDYGQTDIIVVGLFVYAVLGLASDLAVRALERRVLSYRQVLGS